MSAEGAETIGFGWFTFTIARMFYFLYNIPPLIFAEGATDPAVLLEDQRYEIAHRCFGSIVYDPRGRYRPCRGSRTSGKSHS